MSNTSKVTPYESIESSTIYKAGTDIAYKTGTGVAMCIGAIAVGTVALVQWLAEETAEDKAAVQQLKEQQQRERLIGNSPQSLRMKNAEPINYTAINLNIDTPESLVRSAEKLGYKVVEKTLAKQPLTLMSNASGERLAIGYNDKGRITLHTASPMPRTQSIIRQHTLDRAIEHLKDKGMNIQTAKTPNGEVQILARQRDTSYRGGSAEIKTQVYTDGTIRVDISKVKGTRCKDIVTELAQAVGGQVSEMKKKDSYFQLPGEPAKTGVKI
jgi:hypothetical protein